MMHQDCAAEQLMIDTGGSWEETLNKSLSCLKEALSHGAFRYHRQHLRKLLQEIVAFPLTVIFFRFV